MIRSASAFLLWFFVLAACESRVGELPRRLAIEENLDKQLILLRSGHDPARRARLINDILREDLLVKKPLTEGVSVSAVHWDYRTRGVRPAAVIVRNSANEARREVLRLAAGAPAEVYPLKVFIEDGVDTREFTFDEKGSMTVRLAEVEPGTDRLFIVWTDKARSSEGPNPRYIGVQIRPPTLVDRQKQALADLAPLLAELRESRDADRWATALDRIISDPNLVRLPLQESGLEVTGVTGDLWTFGTSPAAVIATNSTDRRLRGRFKVAGGSAADSFPVVVTVAHFSGTSTHVLERLGKKSIRLPPVSAHSKQLFLVWPDKSWSPGEQDARTLGVRFFAAAQGSSSEHE